MPIATTITLDEPTHKYTDAEGRVYQSVSTIIGRYKEPFKRVEVARKVSRKTGQTIEEILTEWDSAAPYGTAVHKQLENFFLGAESPVDLIASHLPTLEQWRSVDAEFTPEAIVCHPELPIAGTADLLVERQGKFSIVDWKTNKAIYQNSFGGKMMRGCLSHLEDCNFIHYSLQLSFYARMLGEPVHKLTIVHLPRDTDRLEIIPCPYLKREVDLIIEEFKRSSYD